MGGNNATLLEDIQKNKKNISLSSEAILTSHTSFITYYQEFLTIFEHIEDNLKELELREVALKQLEKEVIKEKEVLHEREKLCVEREQEVEVRELAASVKEESLRETEKRMQQNAAKFPSVVHFNISGTKFAMTKEKLLHHKGSLFEQMITSDHYQHTSEIFIERDPTYFQFVMRFLPNGGLVPPENKREWPMIEKEFAYYKIPFRFSLGTEQTTSVEIPQRNLIEPNAVQLPIGTKQEHSTTDIFREANLFQDKIREWLPNKRFELIYKASAHGFTVQDFHQMCDNKGPTLVIVHSTNNFLFGGYTPIPWNSSNCAKVDPQMFIFTLSNPHNIPPTKFSLYPKSNTGIRCREFYGPCFGNGDICIPKNFQQKNTSYTDFPISYIDTWQKGCNTFTGAFYFTTKDIEVFSVL